MTAETEALVPVAWRYRWPRNNGDMESWSYTDDQEEAVSLAADDGEVEALHSVADLTRERERREEAERERDEWRASSKMFEGTAKEAARGIECLSEIDDAWDAFGTAGNRAALTLAEQIASRERELEAAEARLAEVKVENARLREALQKIDALDESMGHDLKERHAFEAVDIARTALASGRPE